MRVPRRAEDCPPYQLGPSLKHYTARAAIRNVVALCLFLRARRFIAEEYLRIRPGARVPGGR
jgi:hypothetical protein